MVVYEKRVKADLSDYLESGHEAVIINLMRQASVDVTLTAVCNVVWGLYEATDDEEYRAVWTALSAEKARAAYRATTITND